MLNEVLPADSNVALERGGDNAIHVTTISILVMHGNLINNNSLHKGWGFYLPGLQLDPMVLLRTAQKAKSPGTLSYLQHHPSVTPSSDSTSPMR
jgi:hypothetical protein